MLREDNWRMSYHLMPPQGWLNDPNGLCYMNGYYHVFFQYSPDSPMGGEKVWGHYRSHDLLTWEFTGIAMTPDQVYDRDGVYSGSALVEDGKMHIFYTGNVKEAGDYDYITAGRGAATVHALGQEDGTITDKEVVLDMEDYPEGYSCHIRDPKVWKEADGYYMLLGARTMESEGRALLYGSKDMMNWELQNVFQREEPFGYMWECPDMLKFDGQYYLSVSPQGVAREELRYANVYQSGYFPVKGDFRKDAALGEFVQWDYGFDFYAPQTFQDSNGRTLLIGWMGLPDIEEEYQNPTVERGWQHCMTMVREITRKEDGSLCQMPVEEYKSLRKEQVDIKMGESYDMTTCFEMEVMTKTSEDITVSIGSGVKVSYRADTKICSLEYTNQVGAGRTKRSVKLKKCECMQLYMDHSSIEFYLNGGTHVMSSRCYPDGNALQVKVEAVDAVVRAWNMI